MKMQLAALATAAACISAAHGASVLLAGFDGNNTYIRDNAGTEVAGGTFQSAGDKWIRDPHQSAAAATAGFTAELYMANNIGKEMQWTNVGTTLGTWGSGAQGPFSPAPITSNNNLIYVLDQNSGVGTLEFRVSNTGSDNIALEYLFFSARPDSSGSTQMTVSYASGDLTASGGGSTVVSYTSTSYTGYDVDLTSILTDNTLGAGESAVFTLVTPSALTNRFYVDDIGMSGSITAVPEPSSAALLGLAGLALILRRRK
ncbi:MAG: PEP-CTERM sorting domain-containing protein [Akkermansiaceae bacterium]|nr:PEP-CTERM sorting domain-containing protein [Akkermansiaceae bacterium]